jgi:hypothetical protein
LRVIHDRFQRTGRVATPTIGRAGSAPKVGSAGALGYGAVPPFRTGDGAEGAASGRAPVGRVNGAFRFRTD